MKGKAKLSFKISNLPNSTYVLVLSIFMASILVPNFFTPGNITTLLTQACILMILSMAMSMCLMMGCIDLSLGGIVSMSGVVMALCLSKGVNAQVSILAGLICGTLFGSLNGFVVTKMKVPPFIATFGGLGHRPERGQHAEQQADHFLGNPRPTTGWWTCWEAMC